MHILPLRRNAAFTLTEVTVSTAIMVLIFGAMAYLTFVTGRSTFQVREQSISQMQAASAAERITNTLRNAATFRPCDGDDMATTLTCVRYDIPDTTEVDGFKTGVVAFVDAKTMNSSDGVVKIFEDESDYVEANLDKIKADWEYIGVQDFSVVFNTPSWITISAAYNYRGFGLPKAGATEEEIHHTRLAGEFLTDVIAKNHHPGESAHYAETTSTLFQL